MSFARRKVLGAPNANGCRFVREGSRQTLDAAADGGTIAVPRHREVKPGTARDIARRAGVRWSDFERELW